MGKIAIIDMGTNTFHLLVADAAEGIVLHRSHEAVKIGKGGINQGVITDDACRRAVDAMKKFRSIIDAFRADDIHAFGTSAFRNAWNGQTLADDILLKTGIQVRIIGGDEEAGLIFEGIRAGLDLGVDTNLVMDIGAGSVEFILGNRAGIQWKQSFEIGGQRLLEQFMEHDPINHAEQRALDEHFIQTLPSLFENIRKYQPRLLVGSSGSFDTLSEMYSIQEGLSYYPDAPETPLTVEGFHRICNDLTRLSRQERIQLPGMIEMRVDMIVVACCLIRFVLNNHAFDGIRVSTYSLKEGALSRITGRPIQASVKL